jgi:hypothetical protein
MVDLIRSPAEAAPSPDFVSVKFRLTGYYGLKGAAEYFGSRGSEVRILSSRPIISTVCELDCEQFNSNTLVGLAGYAIRDVFKFELQPQLLTCPVVFPESFTHEPRSSRTR